MLTVQGTNGDAGAVREWKGRVATIVPRSNWEAGSRSFPVIIRIENQVDQTTVPPTPALREGMMAEASFQGRSVDAILVPKDAIVRTSRGSFIFVVNPTTGTEPTSVRQVMVTTGIGTGTWIQVTGESLAAGQQVVTEGAERLRAFQAVQIMTGEPGAAGQGTAPAAAG